MTAVIDRDLWERGKIDQRCRSCGRVEAGGSWCSLCSSTDLEYVTHAEISGCLATGRRGNPQSLPKR